VARPEARVDKSNTTKAKGLDAVPLEVALSASLRDVMIAELNDIDSEDAAAKWAHRRLKEKNKLNAADAKHIEEAFRAKLLSLAIHDGQALPQSENGKQDPDTTDGRQRKARSTGPSPPVDKAVLTHPETPACSRP